MAGCSESTRVEEGFWGYCESPVGVLRIVADGKAITGIYFGEEREGEERLNGLVVECRKQLMEYFAGSRKRFDLRFELTGTEFQKEVWRCLMEIPYGQTWSYGEVARKIGREKAVRAVANAIGANRSVIVVPCHRVIGSDGSMTGFGGGIWRKECLLELEGGLKKTE